MELIDSEHFAELMAEEILEPRGEQRADMRNALLGFRLERALLGKAKVEDWFFNFGDGDGDKEREKPEQSPEMLKAKMQYNMAMAELAMSQKAARQPKPPSKPQGT